MEMQVTSEGEKVESGFSFGSMENKTTGEKFTILEGKANKNTKTGENKTELNVLNSETSSTDLEYTLQSGFGYLATNLSELGRATNDLGILITSFLEASVEEFTGGNSGILNLEKEK